MNRNRSKVDIGKNRYRPILKNCLESIKYSIDKINIDVEIVIGDFESIDYNISWIHDCLKNYKYKLNCFPYQESPFTDGKYFDRGKARNIIGNMAEGNNILWLDCDMIINENIIIHGLEANKKNKAYFPICFYNLTEDNKYGWWDVNACGICMLTKNMFKECRWPEYPQHQSFHAEDTHYFRIVNSKFDIVRNKEDKYFHQFHPGRNVNRVERRDIRKNEWYPNYININKNIEEL